MAMDELTKYIQNTQVWTAFSTGVGVENIMLQWKLQYNNDGKDYQFLVRFARRNIFLKKSLWCVQKICCAQYDIPTTLIHRRYLVRIQQQGTMQDEVTEWI